LGLLRHVEDFVERKENSKFVLFPWVLKLRVELLEDFVSLLRVLLQILKKFMRSFFLYLGVFGFKIFPNIGEFYVGIFTG